jgi:signal peptidase II
MPWEPLTGGINVLKKKYIILLATVGCVVILDLITKAYITSNMFLHESYPVIPGFFSITYIRNPGAAFGFLASASPMFRSAFFLIVTIFVIAMIFYYIVTSRLEEALEHFSLSLILAGALGNTIDRIRYGEVVDFLDVYIGSHHWPAFNVADSAISVGAVLLVLALIKNRHASAETKNDRG